MLAKMKVKSSTLYDCIGLFHNIPVFELWNSWEQGVTSHWRQGERVVWFNSHCQILGLFNLYILNVINLCELSDQCLIYTISIQLYSYSTFNNDQCHKAA